MAEALVILGWLIWIFPKPNWAKFLDSPLVRSTSGGDTQTSQDGTFTISTTVSESVWTVRVALTVFLFGFAFLMLLVRKGHRSA